MGGFTFEKAGQTVGRGMDHAVAAVKVAGTKIAQVAKKVFVFALAKFQQFAKFAKEELSKMPLAERVFTIAVLGGGAIAASGLSLMALAALASSAALIKAGASIFLLGGAVVMTGSFADMAFNGK